MAALDRYMTGRWQATDGSSSLRWWAMARPVAAALLIGIATPTIASDPLVGITVAAVSGTETVSNSRPPLITYMAFKVDVVNNSTNTINNVRLVGSTSVAAASFVPSSGLNCATTTGANVIECPIGQLRGSGAGTSSFVVVFQAPPTGTSVDFNWTLYYGEGSNDSGGAAHVDTTIGVASVALGTPSTTKLKTYVPPGGGTFYTGLGVATPDDRWTTTVDVPTPTTAEVTESTLLSTCAPDLLTCEVSDLSIPGTFPLLTITLRRDASTIAKGAKISSAKIYYTGSVAAPIPGPLYPYDVLPCTDTTYGPLPQPGIPCIHTRTEFTKKTAPTPDWVGDWEFVIWAKTNGKYTQ
jgi:hypothetical protein